MSISTPTITATLGYNVLAQPHRPEMLQWPEVEVPDVMGMHGEDAYDELRGVNLSCHITWSDPSIGWHYYVIEQNPPAGTLVRMGSSVEIILVYPGYFVPDVIGLSLLDATRYIAYAGLFQSNVYQTTADSADWGIVIAQEPDPGALWGHEPPVTLVIGQQSPVTTVPNISPSTTTTTIQQHRAP